MSDIAAQSAGLEVQAGAALAGDVPGHADFALDLFDWVGRLDEEAQQRFHSELERRGSLAQVRGVSRSARAFVDAHARAPLLIRLRPPAVVAAEAAADAAVTAKRRGGGSRAATVEEKLAALQVSSAVCVGR